MLSDDVFIINVISGIVLTYATTGPTSDRLTGVGGWQLTYDAHNFGNPTRAATYNGEHLEDEILYTWEGRSLTRYRQSELSVQFLDVKYTYDASGLRVRKTVGTTEHRYVYDGSNLVYENYGSNTLRFLYDERGLLLSFILTNTSGTSRYDYVRDIMLNIIGLTDEAGNLVVRYTYDAWGNILSTTGSLASTVGAMNPFRYKGYYYDSETAMYYCMSRYYVPAWCRWLSMDKFSNLDTENPAGINLYQYCNNNPIMYIDATGQIVISIGLLIAGFLIGASVGILSSVISQGITKGWSNINGWQVLLDGIIGGISGLLGFSGIGALGSAFISAGLGFAGSVGGDLINSNGDWKQVNWAKAVIMTAVDFVIGWGPGAQNQTQIGNSLGKTLANNRSANIIENAMIKQNAGLISKRGFQGVLNIYGRQLAASISKSMTGIMLKNVGKEVTIIAISGIANVISTWLFCLWEG